jgi:antitoxin component of MazEF toxin-antitoxin module
MQATYPVKVQAIRSKGRTDRFYVFIPLPLAAAIGLEAGEKVQWSLSDRDTLAVRRLRPTPTARAESEARQKKLRRK